MELSIDKENLEPFRGEQHSAERIPATKKKLSLDKSKKNAKTTDCFDFLVDDEALNKATKSYCPKQIINGPLKIFLNGLKPGRKKTDVQKNSYEEILFTDKASELSYWLSAFVKETRKIDRSEYTPKTLYMLIAGLQREIRLHKQSGQAFNLFSDPQFESLRNVCDHEFRRLHQKGVGTSINHTEALTEDDERKLWDRRVLNVDTPTGLLNCVFFYNGKNFACEVVKSTEI